MSSGLCFVVVLCLTVGLWTEANADCISRNGNLASVHSTDEYKIVYDLIKTVTGKTTRAWIGGHDTVKEGVWQWTDGSDFAYKLFPSGQPDNAGNREHCAEMNYKDKPNDDVCTDKKPYVCAVPL